MKNTNYILITLFLGCIAAGMVYGQHVAYSNDCLVNNYVLSDSSNIDSLSESIEFAGSPTNDDPWMEIKNIVKEYYGKSGISYKGTIKVLDGNTDEDKTLEEKSFSYALWNGNYQYRIDEIEVVQKKNLLLVADHAAKTITLTREEKSISKAGLFDIATFKKILMEKMANVRIAQEGKDKVLTIDSITDPNIQGYRIYYSPETYQVRKILIGMVRTHALDADETDEQLTNEEDEYYYYLEVLFNQSEKLDSQNFDPEKKFISIRGRDITLAPDYNQYQLINNY